MKQVLFLTVLLGMIPVSATTQVPDEQLLAGSAWLVKGNYSKAVESLSLAISRNNADDQLFIKRGMALLKIDETTAAIDDFNEANLIISQVADLWLAKAYARAGDKEKAFAFLISHLKSPFRESEDSIKKDPAFDNLQNEKEWIDLWNQEWYDDSEKTLSDVQYHIRKNQIEEAISLLDQEISRSPDKQELLLARGKVFNRQGNYAAAIGDLSSVISADKRNKTAYAQRSYAYLKTQRYKEAVADITKALRIDPTDFILYLQRANAYAGLTDYNSAVKDMQVYMKYFDDDLKAVYQCGEYYYAAGDYIQALKLFNRNLTEDPNNALFYKARGKAYIKTSTYRYAINDLTMSLDLNPDDAETWMYHGIAAIETGDVLKGCSSLRKARKMGSVEAGRVILEKCDEVMK